MDCAGDAPLSQFDREVSNSTIGEAWNTTNSHLRNIVGMITLFSMIVTITIKRSTFLAQTVYSINSALIKVHNLHD